MYLQYNNQKRNKRKQLKDIVGDPTDTKFYLNFK
jgi:hypothetical protein